MAAVALNVLPQPDGSIAIEGQRPSTLIRPVATRDAEQIAGIYNYYVTNTIITFEGEPVAPDQIARRIERIAKSHPWLVFEDSGTVIGYAYASRWHSRCAYRLSVETTIYLAREQLGRGIGRQLYGALLDALRVSDFHCAIGGIALPNAPSIALHESFGFKKVAEFSEIGRKFGKWVDVGYWQLIL